MKTLATVRLVASTLALATLALGCAVGSAEDAEPSASDGPVGTDQAALSPGLVIWQGAYYVGETATYTEDTHSLGAMDNMAEAVQNTSGDPITLWSGPNFTGWCQVILGYMSFPNLTTQDIGPQRLSSIQLGNHCNADTSTMTAMNDTALSIIRCVRTPTTSPAPGARGSRSTPTPRRPSRRTHGP
jgi:Peptidase inhibitor family I36